MVARGYDANAGRSNLWRLSTEGAHGRRRRGTIARMARALPPVPHHPNRRQVLGLLGGLGGIGLLTLAGCGGGDDPNAAATGASQSGSGSGSGSTTGDAGTTSCTVVPEETAGPYPGDGSNGPDVLRQDGVVRSDLRSSFGSASGRVDGVPLTMTVTVLDLDDGCTPLQGAALYAWHCDADGRYSMYTQGATNENWLRGVQPTGTDGRATFTTVFPGAYTGRWPHVHFEVYPSVNAATSGGTKLTTSQLAFPEETCTAVYATSGYEASRRNFPQTPLTRDMVFADGVGQQMVTMSGSVASGLTSELTIAVRGTAV